jgi:hypothetical protein
VVLRDGRELSLAANGARGYPQQPASDDELAAKFLTCARRTIPAAAAERLLASLRRIETVSDIRELTPMMSAGAAHQARARASTP